MPRKWMLGFCNLCMKVPAHYVANDPALLKYDLLHTPAFFANQIFQLSQKLGADAGGVVGEIYEIAFVVFKNMETEFIAPMIACQVAVQGLDAAFVAFMIASGAQGDGQLLW